MGIEDQLPDIEKLRRLQAEEDAKVAEKKKQEETEAQLRARAKEDLKKRESALKELALLQAELDKLRAARIEERIERSKALRESEAAKEAELQRVQNELKRLEEWLEEVSSLVKGRRKEEIAEEVKTALDKAQKRKKELEEALSNLEQELKSIRAELVSDDEIQKYQQLLERIDSLNNQIAEIETNPYVLELLFAEAKEENEIRDLVVREAVGFERDPKSAEFIERVVQRFLTEEFEFRKFNEIQDPTERLEAMRRFAFDMATIVGGIADSTGSVDLAYPQKASEGALAGVLLKNLVGKLGTLYLLLTLLERVASSRHSAGEPRDKSITIPYINQHLGTLNFLRALAYGLKVYGQDILGHRLSKGEWDKFNMEFSRYYSKDYDGIYSNGPLIPSNVDEATKERIRAEFEKTIKEIQAWERSEVEREKIELVGRIAEHEAKIQDLERLLSEIESEEKRLSQKEQEIKQAEEEIKSKKRELANVQMQITNLQTELAKLESQLDSLGPLSWIKRRQLQKEINNKQKDIRELEKKKEELEADIKKKNEELAKHREERDELQRKIANKSKLNDELRRWQESLYRMKQRLEDLNKAYA